MADDTGFSARNSGSSVMFSGFVDGSTDCAAPRRFAECRCLPGRTRSAAWRAAGRQMQRRYGWPSLSSMSKTIAKPVTAVGACTRSDDGVGAGGPSNAASMSPTAPGSWPPARRSGRAGVEQLPVEAEVRRPLQGGLGSSAPSRRRARRRLTSADVRRVREVQRHDDAVAPVRRAPPQRAAHRQVLQVPPGCTAVSRERRCPVAAHSAVRGGQLGRGRRRAAGGAGRRRS